MGLRVARQAPYPLRPELINSAKTYTISTPELLKEVLWGTLKQSVLSLVFMKNNQKRL